MMKKNLYILLAITLISIAPFSHTLSQPKGKKVMVSIESTVRDSEGNSIAGAWVYGSEGVVRVQTKESGQFAIQIPVSSELRIEADGYYTKIIETAEPGLSVVLEKAPFLMGEKEEVFIPFGKTTRREVSGAVSTINPRNYVKYDNTQYVYDAIQGRVPGVMGNSNIRGIGNALIVVDGVRRDPSDINLEEVEQVTVLKDAGAAMLYGTYARNGVVLITTKRGEAFKRKLNFSAEQGISTPLAIPSYLNSADYMGLYNEALANDGLPPLYSQGDISNNLSGTNPYRYPNVDYYSNEFLKKNLNFSKFLGEFSGGNSSTQYYANIGWIRGGSLLAMGKGADAANNRFNVRGNVNFKVNNFISSHLDIVAIFEVGKSPNGNFWNDAGTLRPNLYSPLLPIELVTNSSILETAKLVKDDYILGGTTQYQNNVYGNMFMSGQKQEIRRTVQFSNGIDFDLKKITKGLKFKTYLSFDIFNKFEQNVTNTYAVYQPTWDANANTLTSLVKVGLDQSSGVQNLTNSSMERTFGFYGMFDYKRTFKDVHNISGILLGYTGLTYVNDVVQNERQSHLGLRLAYDFDKKYFVEFNSVLPYSVKLEKGSRIGFSPSLGLGWVVADGNSSEGNVVDYLKLRASAGMIMNDLNLGYFYYNSTYRSSGSKTWNDGKYSTSYVYIDRSANPELGYERMKTINFGVESYLFERTLYADMNLFHTRDMDKVVRRTNYYPEYMGSNYPYENFGMNSYTGAELGLQWSKGMGEVSLEIGANLLYSVSKVIKSNELWENDYQYRKGNSVTSIFALESLGLFRDANDVTGSPLQRYSEVAPGDIKYKDQNNDGVIDDNDQVKIGNSQAPFSYGVTLKLSYKNFTLFAIGNGRSGYEMFFNNDYYWVDGNDKYSEVVWDRWVPGKTDAAYPRLTSKTGTNNFRNSTFWLTNGDYFSLSRAQLTYNIPTLKLGWNDIKDISLYIRGSNLFMATSEVRKRQLNIASEPQYRSFSLGVKLLF